MCILIIHTEKKLQGNDLFFIYKSKINYIMSKEIIDAEIAEEVKIEGVENTEEKVIEALPYQFVFEGIFNNAKSLGQVVFVDEDNKDNKTSNSISIIRILSNGEKQFFKISVDETSELTIKK